MFPLKGKDAYSSGMRGPEKPAAADEGDMGNQPPVDGGGSEEYADSVKKHVHGPDENGHHHLNLTTLAEELHTKHGGGKKK